MQPFFRGYRLVGGDLVELPPPVHGAYDSDILGAELRVIGQWLRVIDPATGKSFPTVEELDEVLQQEAEARKAAEAREQQETAARVAAEAALHATLVELARLRGEDTTGA